MSPRGLNVVIFVPVVLFLVLPFSPPQPTISMEGGGREGGEKHCSEEEEEEEGKEGGKNIGEREKGERKGSKQRRGRKSDIVQRAQGGDEWISFSISLCDLF